MTPAAPADKPTGRDEVMAALIAALRHELETKEPLQVDLRAVAERAGVNHGLIHRHFGSKAALVGAVANVLGDEILDGLDASGSVADRATEPFVAVSRNPIYGKILIWSRAEGLDPEDLGVRFQLMRRSIDLLIEAGVEPREAQTVISMLSTIAVGWTAFAPVFTHRIVDGDPEVAEELRERAFAYARELVVTALAEAEAGR